MKKLTISLCLLFCFVSPVLADEAGVVTVPAFVDAGVSDAGVAAPSAAVVDPIEHPAQAWDDAKAAKKIGWTMLVFFALMSICKALAYSRDALKGLPLLGKAAEWLATGKRAVILVGFTTLSAAGYDAIAAGGSPVAALMSAGLALAGWLHSTTPPKVTPADEVK